MEPSLVQASNTRGLLPSRVGRCDRHYGLGDYQLNSRLPTLSEVGTYIFGGLVLAPFIAALGWLLSFRARRGLRGGGSADR